MRLVLLNENEGFVKFDIKDNVQFLVVSLYGENEVVDVTYDDGTESGYSSLNNQQIHAQLKRTMAYIVDKAHLKNWLLSYKICGSATNRMHLYLKRE